MRAILIGAVGSTEIVLRAMQDVGIPPILLATLEPQAGRKRHADYVDLASLVTSETQTLFIENANDREFVEHVRTLNPDIVFVIGWSQIVGSELRATARHGCVGFHPSLLPSLRGRAVIGWTILLGLKETGATLFQIDDGVDDGPILAQMKIDLGARENVATLVAKLSAALDTMIRELLPRLSAGDITTRAQEEISVSYCARRTATDSLIDWGAGLESIDRLIRASSEPYAGAFTFTRKRRVTIWAAEPWPQKHPFHAAQGQIVEYVDGDPIVNCGNGAYLRITKYDAGPEPLKGQVRFHNFFSCGEHTK